MITFKQFLAEEKQDLAEYLATNCQEACQTYLKAQGVLWRGVRLDQSKKKIDFGDIDGYEIEARTNRRPRDSSGAMHIEADKYFKKEFGIALRSESVFAYSRRSTELADYGTPCVIFPYGAFKIFWSSSIRDFTTGANAWADKLQDGDPSNWMNDFLNAGDYQEGPNIEAIRENAGFEKMVVCKKYLAVEFQNAQQALEICEQAYR